MSACAHRGTGSCQGCYLGRQGGEALGLREPVHPLHLCLLSWPPGSSTWMFIRSRKGHVMRTRLTSSLDPVGWSMQLGHLLAGPIRVTVHPYRRDRGDLLPVSPRDYLVCAIRSEVSRLENGGSQQLSQMKVAPRRVGRRRAICTDRNCRPIRAAGRSPEGFRSRLREGSGLCPTLPLATREGGTT